ncbi:tumor necrosis factor receptor superfamily member 6 isoform X2 [Salarias fasciatus]|uniref:Tumor necrosis factor receptor superfamily member 6-like n=1 Tax=Salarias fasciatus TaxID=181472 RepID=A0A672J9I0_SALFA|nr:tumor necrosis factor receptor superfamily member 6-like isoform X2 [Salarias fasciatus]
MASNGSTVLVRFIAFILFFYLSHGHSFSKDEVKQLSPLREIIRNRRQVCLDGTYEHEGRTCCQCAAGQYLKEHCTSSPDDGKCEFCQTGTFNSHPNHLESCRPCTSCSQPNANLEVAEECTKARDTKCRCKQDHYCSSNTGNCEICHPCTVCSSVGVKEACTPTSDTVCQEPKGSNTGAVVGSVVGVLVVVAVLAVGFVLWRRRQAARNPQPSSGSTTNGNRHDEEKKPLNVPDVDIQPSLPQIAEELGWKDMKDLAMKVGIQNAAIDACQLDHPNDSQEQTLHLLRKWVERQGRDSPSKLVQMLCDLGKKAKAEKIVDILHSNKPAAMS